MSTLSSLIEELKSELKSAHLIAVSKTKPIEDIKEVISCAHLDFGENKVQELEEKASQLKGSGVKWHFIGHLQSNKINQLLKVPDLVSIHSIGSIKLLNKLLNKKVDKIIGLFLQVNTSLEDEKDGFNPEDDLKPLIDAINEHEFFYFQGFMTIGRIRTVDFEQDAHKSFELLKSIRDKYGCGELSMGMSNDYQIALKYGTNWVRVGSKIFGKR